MICKCSFILGESRSSCSGLNEWAAIKARAFLMDFLSGFSFLSHARLWYIEVLAVFTSRWEKKSVCTLDINDPQHNPDRISPFTLLSILSMLTLDWKKRRKKDENKTKKRRIKDTKDEKRPSCKVNRNCPLWNNSWINLVSAYKGNNAVACWHLRDFIS